MATMSIGLQMYLKKAQDDPVAAYNAALLLESEHMGQATAQHFYLRAALGGYIPAMWQVAGLFITGQFVTTSEETVCGVYTQDPAQGVAWLHQAAKTGDSTANYLLARAYLDGVGVECNRAKALYFLKEAAFPSNANPYEPTEALVFGSVSAELSACVSQVLRERKATSVG